MGYIIWLVLSLLLTIGVWFVPEATMGTFGKLALTSFGGLSLLVLTSMYSIKNLWQIASPREAIVRTGQGDMKIVIDGGIWFIGLLHKMTRIPLTTMKIKLSHKGKESLITGDRLRADIAAEFFIKVEPNKDADGEEGTDAGEDDLKHGAIRAFSRSIESDKVDTDIVTALVKEKMISALRTVAAKSTLFELNQNREKFEKEVSDALKVGLAKNGLTLENVTISELDQSTLSGANKENIFDAEGLQRMAEITQKAAVETNRLVREAENEIKERDVTTQKQILNQELDQTQAEAEKEKNEKNAKKQAEREANEFAIAQDEAVALRDVQKNQSVKLAEVEKEKKTLIAEKDKQTSVIVAEQKNEVANKQREQAVDVAEVKKNEAMEVAKTEKEIALAEKGTEQSKAEAERLAAEAIREENDQKVQTVTVVETAKRAKQQQVIAAQATAESKLETEKKAADAKAYGVERDAEAREKAAEADYQARVKSASATQQAAEMEAAGDEAKAMVGVKVEGEKVAVEKTRQMIQVEVNASQVEVDKSAVEVEAARVAVERQDLEQKAQFEGVAVDFELAKKRIEAKRDLGIAQAQALPGMLASADVKLIGTPDDAADMLSKFTASLKFQETLDGLGANDEDTIAGKVTKAAVGAIEGAAALLNPDGSDKS